MRDVSSPVVRALRDQDRLRILDRAVPRTLRAGERLYLAGDRARRVHLLTAGVVKLTARNGDGDETILALAIAGDLVGEVAAVDRLPQPLDAVAATRCDVIGIDADLLLDVLHRNPQAAIELANLMAQRTRWICETALERTASGVQARLAGRLLDLADLLGTVSGGVIEVELPLAQGDLGRLAGMCRESACKTLRSFRAAGLLDYNGRRLRILRPDGLETIRCSGRVGPLR